MRLLHCIMSIWTLLVRLITIIGSNGAGKTSLLNVIAGVFHREGR